MSNYHHSEIEKKWQKFWEENKTFSIKNPGPRAESRGDGKKFYALDMFPYPSGAGLHVGHPEGYTATDILSRKRRMEGYDVLHPMGWDAFGLPAENFAIKTGVHPEKSTNKNIENFTRQIKSLGFSYDWEREISTTDPKYYKWTQELFLKFYKKGLLYEDNKPMNWCPSCKVICANEEVEQGMHERCGNPVTKKSLKQWMFKITDYAERLLQDLETPNVILIHGLGGNGDSGWTADIKKYFDDKNAEIKEEENKIKCFSPTFPNAEKPEYSEWKQFFEENLLDKITPQTVFIGHSLGCGFLQRYLSETEKNIKFSEIIFIAPTVSDCGIPEISNFFTEKKETKKKRGCIPDGCCSKDNMAKPSQSESIFSDLLTKVKKKTFKKRKKLVQIKSVLKNKNTSLIFDGEILFSHFLSKPHKERNFRQNWALTIMKSLSHVKIEGNIAYIESQGQIFKIVFSHIDENTSQVKTFYRSEKLTREYQMSNKSYQVKKEKTQVFNYQKISDSAENIFIFAGGKDPYIKTEEFNFLAEKLSAKLIFDENQEHFWGDYELKKFPELSLKIQKIAQSSLDWPQKIKAMQKNWIGKSEGAEVDFTVENSDTKITVYTTRPDTLFGATYFVLSPEHPLVSTITSTERKNIVEEYQAECSRKSELERTELNKDKTGVFTGSYVINPVNNKKIPVWIADYVMMGYGTGAIMSVPAHDERDKEFAKKYNLPILEVVKEGILENSEFLNGLSVKEAKEKMIAFLEKEKIGKRKTNYKLRDWIFTRQRYWGEPIPLVFDENGKCYPLDASELPLLLPETPNYEPSATGESPLAKIEDWVNVLGYITESGTVRTLSGVEVGAEISNKKIQKFRRETSTMPNWAGSSWYWLRFMDSKNNNEAWSMDAEKHWGSVDLYVGGAEHAVLHLLYARFWHKALYDMGLVSTKEPFKKLVNQGMILSYAFEKQTAGGGLVAVDEVTENPENSGKYFWTNPETGEKQEVKKITAKMSKSLKNVVNPDDIVEQFGADTLRMYEMFMGPFEQSKEWNTKAVEGMHRFLAKIYRYFTENEISESCPNKELISLTHKTVKKVSQDIEDFKFNTAISQMMVWMNEFSKLDTVPKIAGGKFVRLLAPFAPHLAEELWKKFKPESETITFESWPSYKEELTVDSEITYGVQVNGKIRGELTIDKDAPKEECLEKAKQLEKVQKFLEMGEIKKEIFVPGKIIGFVVK